MTGHIIARTQNQTPSFLTTLQATLDVLDDISGRIDENTYLTLTNNLQQLYNMHTSNPTSNANPPIITPINYTRNDISYASIRNFDISNANPIISNANPIISNANPIISNADIINNNNNANNNTINENIQSRIQSLNEESNRIGYSTRTRLALYGNVFGNA